MALGHRDRGCAFPGCDRPPGWCDAHHVQHWADGGPTNLDNTVLYCRHHHTVIHTGHWTVTMNPDGHPDHTPPVWIDPHQHPRRNHLHHPEPWSGTGMTSPQRRQ
uniref:HNH endonuclease signature motif containing protein n=1 Tax=Nakamurella leprariae TaxID=2803911 RepID=UPI0038B2DC01